MPSSTRNWCDPTPRSAESTPAAFLHWTVVDTYIDNDVSAYRGRKRRPQYQRMLADLEEGRIDAVIAWDRPSSPCDDRV